MTKNISPVLEPHPFTIDDYQRMVDTGILEEDSKVELLAGQIVKTSPIGRFHAACIIRLNKILVIGSNQRKVFIPKFKVTKGKNSWKLNCH